MELDNTNQVSSENLQNQQFDVLIAVAGFESRCTYLSSKIDTSRIPTKILLSFTENRDILFRKYNEEQFAEWGFSFKHVSTFDSKPIRQILDQVCLTQPKKTLNILCDYSAMPKIWYKEIINYFLELEEQLTHIRLWFSYSPASYSRAQTNTGKKYFSEEAPFVKPDKPITLILGLGYEKGKAEELLRRLDAQITFLFYADPALDDRFVKDVIENNKSLLDNITESNLIKYPIYDLNSITSSLTDVCLNFRLGNQLVLAPVGPKPFTLMCYILAARYPDIKIWELKTLGDIVPYDRKAQGDLLVYQLEFTLEEVDYDD